MQTTKINRRNFIKMIGAGAAAITTQPLSVLASEKNTRKPNVVLIVTDDQGSVDVNCFGAKDLITPNLDDLAQEGTRFTQFYVAAPVCSPSRAALLTGRYPQRAQLPSNAYGRRGMPASQVTMAEMMREHGYRTGIFGKWHLGEILPLSPNQQGFDEFLGHKVGCIDNYSHFFYWKGPNRHDLWKDESEVWENGNYFPDMIVREATRFIKENQDKPFFLYVPFNTPHYPMQAEPKFVDMYKHIDDPNRNRYAAFVTSLDDKIGQVIAKLDEFNLRENTIIVFLSDNGHSVEERAFGGGGSAGPYRGHKFTVWEGGIRVPCIMSWPKHIPANAVRDQLTASIDIMPTIAEYCSVKLPDRTLDGRSLSAIIQSAEAETTHPTMHWQRSNRWAVRQGKWKLVFDEKPFLSDMNRDVSESTNLVAEHPEIVERLTALHQQWLKDVVKQ